MSSTSGPGSKPPLTPILDGFGKPDGKRDAAMSEYGKQFAGAELDVLEEAEEDPEEMARRAAGKNASATARPMAPRPAVAARPVVAAPPVEPANSSTSDLRPSLEPVSDDAHKHRSLPAQPSANLVLDLDGDNQLPEPARPAARPSMSTSGSSGAASLGSSSRQSPAPVRRGLFSGDRITNMLASAAVGLVIMIFPAKQLAHSYEVRKVEPLLIDLEGAIDHPLGVQAGLVAKPETIAAQIHEGREHVRRRYMMIWLMVGLPIGIGLGFAPRPGD